MQLAQAMGKCPSECDPQNCSEQKVTRSRDQPPSRLAPSPPLGVVLILVVRALLLAFGLVLLAFLLGLPWVLGCLGTWGPWKPGDLETLGAWDKVNKLINS